MPIKNHSLKDRLARYRQIRLSVIGRKTGLHAIYKCKMVYASITVYQW